MPSLWNWWSRRKVKISTSKHSEQNHNSNIYSRQKDTLKYESENDLIRPSQQLPFLSQTTLISSDQKSASIVPDVTCLGNDMKRDSTTDTQTFNRKLAAYEIFQVGYQPSKRTDKNDNVYQKGSDCNYSLQNYQNEINALQQNYKPIEDENEIEMRFTRSNIFGGLASRFHRHSLQSVHPELTDRQTAECNRRETMAGYVPRAVSLHDASAILSGRGDEENSSICSPTNYPIKTRDLTSRIYEDKTNTTQHSSHNIKKPSFSDGFSSDLNRDVRQPYRGSRPGVTSAQSSGQLHHYNTPTKYSAKSSSSNANFYFVSSMLLSSKNQLDATDCLPLEDTLLYVDDVHQPKISRSNPHTTDDASEDNVTGDNCRNEEDNKNNDWLSLRQDERDKMSAGEHFQMRTDEISGRDETKYFQAVFNTECEVLY